MVSIETNYNPKLWRAPLLCGAMLLLVLTGVSYGEPAHETPTESASAAVVADSAIAPQAVPASFPILVIEDIAPPSIEAAQESGQSDPAEIAPEPPPTAQPVPPRMLDHAGILSTARMFALGMIETGNKDDVVGGLGEVSRYQIMPSVWKAYSESRSYRDVDVATEVARRHWTSLYEYFKKKTERDPTNFDMYVLWNTRYGYYAAKGFEPARLHPVVRDRAQRFTNLVEDSQRRESELEMAALR